MEGILFFRQGLREGSAFDVRRAFRLRGKASCFSVLQLPQHELDMDPASLGGTVFLGISVDEKFRRSRGFLAPSRLPEELSEINGIFIWILCAGSLWCCTFYVIRCGVWRNLLIATRSAKRGIII